MFGERIHTHLDFLVGGLDLGGLEGWSSNDQSVSRGGN